MAKKRRGSGEGNIYQRSDGRWEARISLGWANGKRVRKSYLGATEGSVQDQLLKGRSAVSLGLPVSHDRQTVEQYLTHWLAETLKPNAKPRSYESFEMIVRKHINPVIGRVRLDKLSPQHIAHLLELKRQPTVAEDKGGKKITKPGLSPQSLVNIRTVLRSALAQALKWGLVPRNVAALVTPPRIPRPEVHVLNPDEARKFLDAAKGSRFESIFVLALTLGMRRGEILGLRWTDVDFETGVLKISQAMQRLAEGLSITEVKTERSRRVLAIPESVVRALRMRRAQQAQERLLAGIHWKDTGLVFTAPNGGMLEPITLHRAFKVLLTEAKLPMAVRFHDLRHSAASLLLAQGVHLRAIMELLGHSSISLTANTYSHVQPAMMREVANVMEEILKAK
jgi:integrase